MRLKLTLQKTGVSKHLPFNYQYPLSSAIYKIISFADKQYASFLHNNGYGEKSFKFFTFSDLRTPFRIQDNYMILTDDIAELVLCFHIPVAAENFVRGLFINQKMEIADKQHKVAFDVREVMIIPTEIQSNTEKEIHVTLEPLSPLVTGRKNDRGYYDYRSPSDEDYADCIRYNLIEKYKTVFNGNSKDISELSDKVKIEVKHLAHPPQERRPVIKAGTPEETKLRGYTKFHLQIIAPAELIELALNAGLGLYNAQGMGCVGVVY